ncbi:indole-3-glycerol-phosphate synthase [Bacillus sp. B15-48]|uniref:indole-3-glycerol-phosphate synthase n=1 Tax=Bacillus sp. B15-48 TaxID=1548601 RepID=UPI00193F85E7|nr:indole-3-glycerol-phosphate synthase [Bacillus sp. B15-48]MBM4761791.1 indole-3-glycerol-phosphate synthase TrpC [Bacillus sp. B15-48]
MEMNKNSQSRKCTNLLWDKYRTGVTPVIPDIKCKSPGEGDLMVGRDPVVLAKSLAAAGAPVLSVVTESEHYGGSLEMLQQIAKAVDVPVLRKDFIKTKEHLQESVEYGASAVLLISSILEKDQLYKLIDEANSLGLEPLVETHNEEEIQAIKKEQLTFLGINNRNILVWEMDDGNVNTTEKLAHFVPENTFVLSESSIASAADVIRATSAGAHGVLVGTTILKAKDPVAMYQELTVPWGQNKR